MNRWNSNADLTNQQQHQGQHATQNRDHGEERQQGAEPGPDGEGGEQLGITAAQDIEME